MKIYNVSTTVYVFVFLYMHTKEGERQIAQEQIKARERESGRVKARVKKSMRNVWLQDAHGLL